MMRLFFKFITSCLGIILGLIAVTVFFYDELPLGNPSSELIKYAGGPFLDMHVHTAGIGAGNSGCYVSEELKNSYKFPIYLRAFGTNKEELEREGDGIILKKLSAKIAESRYVDSAVVLAFDGAVDDSGMLDLARTQIYVPNEFIAQETAKYDNLLFGASINPLRNDALERLTWVKDDGAVLVKWIPSVMLFDPADPRLIPFYQKLVSLRLPLLTHTGHEHSFLGAQQELADPWRLESALKLGVIVIAAHTAPSGESQGEENQQALFALMRKYPNLYADISALTQANRTGVLESALAQDDLRHRLLYGTDWPLQFQLLVSPWYQLKRLRLADIRYISKIENSWDRDVLLKKALGVTDDIFSQSGLFFKPSIPQAKGQSKNVKPRES